MGKLFPAMLDPLIEIQIQVSGGVVILDPVAPYLMDGRLLPKAAVDRLLERGILKRNEDGLWPEFPQTARLSE